jgi:hypothetical protein
LTPLSETTTADVTTASTPDAGTPAPADTSATTAAPDASTPSSGNETTGDTTDAAPASAESDPGPSSLLDAVKDAIRPKETPAPDASADTTTSETKPPDGQESEDDADWTEAELKQVKPHTGKYIRRILHQRQRLRDDLAAVQPELQQHRQLRGYLDQHKLAPEDVNLLLNVGAALRRGDYKAFLDGIEPYRDVARQSLGLDVAPDLRGRIDDGSMTEDSAKELTKARLDAARARADAETTGQQVQQRDTTALQTQLRSAVDNWEASVKGRDPDYALKEPLLRRTTQALLAEVGVPRTQQDAVALAQRAYDEVTAQLARARPAPQPTRQRPAAVSTPSLGANPEPRSMLDVVRQASRARAGA